MSDLIDATHRTVRYKGQYYSVPNDIKEPGAIVSYILDEKRRTEGPIQTSDLHPTGGRAFTQPRKPDPKKGPLGQFAYGVLEGTANIAGALLPGISSEDIKKNLRTDESTPLNMYPESLVPPEGFSEKFGRYGGEQLGASIIGAPLGGLRRVRQVAGGSFPRNQLLEDVASGLRSEAGYSLSAGLGQALGSGYGPEGELIGAIAGFGAPIAARSKAIKSIQGAFIGGDSNWADFKNNLMAFRKAGIDPPTLGTVAPKLRPVEAAFESVPGSYGTFHKRAIDVYNRMNENALEIRRAVSFEDTAENAGRAIAEGGRDAIDSFRTKAAARYTNLDSVIGPNFQVWVGDRIDGLGKRKRNAVPTGFGGAPETARFMETNQYSDSQLDSLISSLKNDAEGGLLPYAALADARSWIGERLTSADFIGVTSFPRAAYKEAYGKISEMMRGAAVQAGAVKEYERANSFWKNNIDSIDELSNILAQRGASPERLYTWAMEGSNIGSSRIKELRGRLTQGQFDVVRSAAMRRMGFPAENVADDFGPDFSPVRFLANYSKMDETARQAMFGGVRVSLKGSSVNLKSALDTLAEIGSLMRAAGGTMANTSGTAGRGLNAATLWAAALTAGVGTAGFVAGDEAAEQAGGGGIAQSLSGLLGAGLGIRFITKKLWTNPAFVTWLAEAQRLPEARIPGHLARLLEIGTDPESQIAIQGYLDELIRLNAKEAQTQMPKEQSYPISGRVP